MASFELLIIGDEILSGRRKDQHFDAALQRLKERGHRLAAASYLPDEPAVLVEHFRRTLAQGTNVISFGGIGATPDDHTRAALATAAGVPLQRHDEAARLIVANYGDAALPFRINMADFPAGSCLIPNPVNQVAGAFFRQHALLPGFPSMAWPMLEWLLGQHYEDGRIETTCSILVPDAREGELIDLMQALVAAHPAIRFSSLPSYGTARYAGPHIEFSTTGTADNSRRAMAQLCEALSQRQLAWHWLTPPEEDVAAP